MKDPRAKAVPSDWAGPLDSWVVAEQAAGRSRATLATRRDHVARAARALGGCPWQVTPAALIDWCGRQVWARETRRSVYASLRSFYRWAVLVEHVEASPAERLPPVSPADPSPRPAPEAIVKIGLDNADDRTRLILELAAWAGMRRGEICQVHHRDLVEDLTGWSLVVHGKGSKTRVVPLPDWLAVQVRAAAGGGWVFPGADGGHLSARWVGKLATRVLPDGWTLHTLRHRFATRAHTQTGDLIAVSRLLGHASVATTQRYVATDADRLRSVVLAAA